MPTIYAVRESIQEIDDNSWIIGERLLLTLQKSTSLSGVFWKDDAGGYFVLSENLPTPLPATRPLLRKGPIRLWYDAGGCNAAWQIGSAFLKVQKITEPNQTKEHVTLDYLHHEITGLGTSITIPVAIYHTTLHDRYYLFTSRVKGETLEVA